MSEIVPYTVFVRYNESRGIRGDLQNYTTSPLEDAIRVAGPINILRIFSLFRRFNDFKKGKTIEEVNGQSFYDFFRGFLKSEIDLSNYSVTLHHGAGYQKYGSNGFYGDSSYQFILDYEDRCAAVLGFETHRDSLLVLQIQGRKRMRDVLKPILWANMLLNVAVDWTKKANIPEIMVLPSRRNDHSDLAKSGNAGLYYDVTAKREGFTYDPETKLYRKVLTK